MRKPKVVAPPKCGAVEYIGSYPGEMTFWCELLPGHVGDHEAVVTWEPEAIAVVDEVADTFDF